MVHAGLLGLSTLSSVKVRNKAPQSPFFSRAAPNQATPLLLRPVPLPVVCTVNTSRYPLQPRAAGGVGVAVAAAGRQPIRITFDTSSLASSVLTATQQSLLITDILPALQARVAGMLNVGCVHVRSARLAGRALPVLVQQCTTYCACLLRVLTFDAHSALRPLTHVSYHV